MADFIITSNAAEVVEGIGDMAASIPDEVLEPVADKLGNEALRLYRGTVRTWNTEVNFTKVTEVSMGEVTVLAGTDNRIYGWVSGGTRPHTIVPRNAPRLVFPSVFVPKTTPGSLQSGPGKSAPPMVFTKRVRHPGTKAREFDKKVSELVDAKAGPEINRVIHRWLRKHG